MSTDAIVESIQLYREAIRATERLYAVAADQLRDSYAWLADQDAMAAAAQMSDLRDGLLMKTYAAVVSDKPRSLEQRQLGRVLLSYLWNEPVMGSQLHESLSWLVEAAAQFQWDELVKPFLQVPALRDEYGELVGLVGRMANLIARCDGDFSAEETARVQHVQTILQSLAEHTDTRTLPAADAFLPTDVDAAKPATGHSGGPTTAGRTQAPSSAPPRSNSSSRDALRWLREEAERLRDTAASLGNDAEALDQPTASPLPADSKQPPTKPSTTEPAVDNRTPEERLQEAKTKLNQLIGLGGIKTQIETLTNFLKMEKLRSAENLPTTRPSLHMAFVGNPGTGKTTVARIVADIYGALGILEKGHLVETDRSGLVAEYAGQTGPKTNAKIDEALDGVLFIDEAYTLIDTSGQDQYGREAVQTLLKRMEDQRDRLVVILAGYPVEMEMMIRSNPGLSSRVGTTLQFDDYTAGELARIFGLMAGKAEYQLPVETRRRLLYGFQYLYQRRDRHFGNGRTARNSFERSVRRLANRLASLAEIDRELLTTLSAEDIEVAGLEQAHLAALAAASRKLNVDCQQCQHPFTISDDQLATDVQCPECQETFTAEWGDPAPEEDA